ncbi:sex comb on midleg-like protein 1 isoform X1 [Macaca nemestrina]|uniref:sex comb on midleg-like protein 1 isoform X1 n=1 Tax=Macaca mulatta TaxID=9544 RepID=UPI000732A360|nr:sex comb on midleg-like protein 1 isoform X1 [Macaca nemestrina]XP_028697660.1 sex comb on midleg-like protein 1 isoform X1 [Macaca mulatta]
MSKGPLISEIGLCNLLKVKFKPSTFLLVLSFIFPFNLLINLPQVKTRIPTYDEDDDTILYAYETKPDFVNKQEPNTVSDASCNTEEQQKTVNDVLIHCQVIYDAMQNLDKKIDVIRRKVSKIQRFRARSLWTNRKRYGYKNYSYQLAKKLKRQKMKKNEVHESFSYPESYSPTLPVSRRENNSPSNLPRPSFRMEEYQRAEPEEDPILSRTPSPVHPSDFSEHNYQPYYASDGAMHGSSSGPCLGNPGANSIYNTYSTDHASAAQPSGMLAQGEPSLVHAPEMMSYSALMENRYTGSSLCFPSGFVTSSPFENDRYIEEGSITKHPSTWSVEAVVLFLKQTDPLALCPLVDLFRSHEIDGKALLLLTSDVLLKHLGVKLGTAVKLCYYIDRLKQGKCFEN